MQLNIELPTPVYTASIGTKDIFYLAYTQEISATKTDHLDESLGNFQFGNLVFDLAAYLNNSRLDDFHFANPVILRLTYIPMLLDNLRSEQLTLLYWNGTTWTNDGIIMMVYDEVNHQIVASVTHLSQFALFVNNPTSLPPKEEPSQRLFLPFITQ